MCISLIINNRIGQFCVECHNHEINNMKYMNILQYKLFAIYQVGVPYLNILLRCQLLYHAGHAPDIYATFDNGMVYKYIKGETLTTTTVRDPSVYKLVARAMARFHRLDHMYSRTNDEEIQSGLWSKIEQFSSLIPERFSSTTTDLQLVFLIINFTKYTH